jgi:phosphatidylserine decarboxylase
MIASEKLNKKEQCYKWLFYIAPHHLISRVVYFITRQRGWIVKPMIKWFIRRFNVDMNDAIYPDISHYDSFNEFFIRALKPEARPIVPGDKTYACPADGTISEAGNINAGQIFQAKGHHYTALELLGGDEDMAALFENGRFATIYLAPYNYHRLHMPCYGLLQKMIHVPGRLFSVAQWTVRAIPRLFARNERLVCFFETETGPLALVLVGAINVAAIETVWSGLVTPPKGKNITSFDYSHTEKYFDKGAEMGRFNMGSTIILLTSVNVEWLKKIRAGQVVKMGELIGHIPEATD